MNKNLLDQLPADERAAAEKLSSAADMMKLSQSFQWNLESQLMDAYPSQDQKQNSFMKIAKPAGWVIAAIASVLLVNWMLRTLLPGVQPAAAPTPTEVSFEASVRQGNICAGPLAAAHGFTVFLTNDDKTQFITLDPGQDIGEMRAFTWSVDGRQLFILGNTTGSGNLYRADPASGQVEPVLARGEGRYMMDAGWSSTGNQAAMWTAQDNKVLYVVNSDTAEIIERPLGNVQILGTPQFWPDGSSIVFYGASLSTYGLYEFFLNDAEPALIHESVESAGSYAFSPDGTQLAYIEYDRELGEARLIAEDLVSRERKVPGTFSIPKGSGSSVPLTAHLSWSVDGMSIVFDVGRGAHDRVIYLAHLDGTDLVKIVDDGYAPALSADGRCLAYINDKQVFLLDLASHPDNAIKAVPVLLADLPTGRGIPNYQLDKLQWSPKP